MTPELETSMNPDLPVLRLAGVIVVDQRGWLLLQERDEFAPTHPEKWALCGGHVEAGEAFDEAAVRELAEETGIEGLDLVHLAEHHVEVLGKHEHWQVYAGCSRTLSDADVVVGEGRRIVFVDPGELAHLPLVDSARTFVELLLASPAYAEWTR